MIGTRLAHYTITAKIGEGGMGAVYRAEDTKLRREVALKVLPAELAGSQERLERFRREARTLAALDHPNIVTLHSVEEAEGVHFLTMQLVDGQPLSELIPAGGMAIERIVDIAGPLTEALAAAHAKGVIHRDLKPANIMVTSDGRVKVLDFGIATAVQVPGQGVDTQTATELLTQAGRLLGTVAYMSPEQLSGGKLDARSDLFSLGVVLYEMATGRRPFSGRTPATTIAAILHEAPSPAASLRASLPASLDAIISRCLEKQPERRFAGAEELGVALRAAPTGPTGDPAVRLRPRLVITALVLAATLAVGFVFWLSDNDESVAVSPVVSGEPSRGPSIAVLPFANASGDPEQDYFSSGLTEELITELSKFQELFVAARTSTLDYKGRSVDVREIGKALGVRYVLQGSVQKSGDALRMTAELSDTTDGRRIWGESYDASLTASDFFTLQDELTSQVVNEIADSYGALFQAEFDHARRKPPANLNSYECVLRTFNYLRVHSAENHLIARDCLERVTDVDTDYVDAKAWLAYLYGEEFHHRYNERVGEYDPLGRALELGEEALRLDPVNQVAHGTLALTLFLRGNFERGIVEARRAVDLNPRNSLWLALMGLYLVQAGDFEQGVPMVHEATKLSPHPPTWFHMAFFYDHYYNGRYEDALGAARLMDWDGDFRIPLFLAASYGQLGRPKGAAAALEELRSLWPRPASELHTELVERHAIWPPLADRLLEGLAQAGMEGLPQPAVEAPRK